MQPGCLGVDAIWQLIGFYGGVRGAKGAGRALGAKEIVEPLVVSVMPQPWMVRTP